MIFTKLCLILASALTVTAQNWDTYPQVPKTASINGFADRIYADLPTCAQDCVKYSVGNTPCPYWDTGCLCVMPQWSGMVASCIAEECSGVEVSSATYLANSICSSAGASWVIPGSLTTALIQAEEVTKGASAAASTTGASAGASATASTRAAVTGSTDSSSAASVSGSTSLGSAKATASTSATSTTSESSSDGYRSLVMFSWHASVFATFTLVAFLI